mmetsp:Transcript_5888/g.12483  ORF Transcript_5888/g.12483 Transcript_5888/m.12483 type:complete len:94 (+) Transcript_5888:652-933(+)
MAAMYMCNSLLLFLPRKYQNTMAIKRMINIPKTKIELHKYFHIICKTEHIPQDVKIASSPNCSTVNSRSCCRRISVFSFMWRQSSFTLRSFSG